MYLYTYSNTAYFVMLIFLNFVALGLFLLVQMKFLPYGFRFYVYSEALAHPQYRILFFLSCDGIRLISKQNENANAYRITQYKSQLPQGPGIRDLVHRLFYSNKLSLEMVYVNFSLPQMQSIYCSKKQTSCVLGKQHRFPVANQIHRQAYSSLLEKLARMSQCNLRNLRFTRLGGFSVRIMKCHSLTKSAGLFVVASVKHCYLFF